MWHLENANHAFGNHAYHESNVGNTLCVHVHRHCLTSFQESRFCITEWFFCLGFWLLHTAMAGAYCLFPSLCCNQSQTRNEPTRDNAEWQRVLLSSLVCWRRIVVILVVKIVSLFINLRKSEKERLFVNLKTKVLPNILEYCSGYWETIFLFMNMCSCCWTQHQIFTMHPEPTSFTKKIPDKLWGLKISLHPMLCHLSLTP